LIGNDEHSMSSLAQAVDQLVSEEALKLVDDYLERRRPGEPMSVSRFYNCRNLEITLRGSEAIENLKLLSPGAAPAPDASADLPDDIATTPAWYTTPVARNLRAALSGKPVIECVAAVRELAITLARLAERRVHHRDVKPENLYAHGGRYVLGDFGLVTRPEDEQLTRPDHIPGPAAYMPSEAFVRWDDADFEKIDVFCLAKTLWVVITRADFPPRGRINAD